MPRAPPRSAAKVVLHAEPFRHPCVRRRSCSAKTASRTARSRCATTTSASPSRPAGRTAFPAELGRRGRDAGRAGGPRGGRRAGAQRAPSRPGGPGAHPGAGEPRHPRGPGGALGEAGVRRDVRGPGGALGVRGDPALEVGPGGGLRGEPAPAPRRAEGAPGAPRGLPRRPRPPARGRAERRRLRRVRRAQPHRTRRQGAAARVPPAAKLAAARGEGGARHRGRGREPARTLLTARPAGGPRRSSAHPARPRPGRRAAWRTGSTAPGRAAAAARRRRATAGTWAAA